MTEEVKVSDMHGMTLLVKLSEGMTFGGNRLQAQRFLYVYEQRYNDRGRELKARPLWGPLGVPDKPNAGYPELLRMLADALEANPPESEPDPNLVDSPPQTRWHLHQSGCRLESCCDQ